MDIIRGDRAIRPSPLGSTPGARDLYRQTESGQECVRARQRHGMACARGTMQIQRAQPRPLEEAIDTVIRHDRPYSDAQPIMPLCCMAACLMYRFFLGGLMFLFGNIVRVIGTFQSFGFLYVRNRCTKGYAEFIKIVYNCSDCCLYGRPPFNTGKSPYTSA